MTPCGDLLVIVPSRGRPQSVQAMVDAWLDTDATGGDGELLWAVDDDDPRLDEYRDAVTAVSDVPFRVHLRVGPRAGMVGTLNEAATESAAQWPMLMFCGDDHRPDPGQRWVETLRTAAGFGGDGPWVVYANDGYQGQKMATSVLLTSDIVAALGYFAPPELWHMNADLIWPEWGRALDRLVYLPDTIVRHHHPFASLGAWDAGYEAVNSAAVCDADDEAHAAYMGRSGRFHADVEKLYGLLT